MSSSVDMSSMSTSSMSTSSMSTSASMPMSSMASMSMSSMASMSMSSMASMSMSGMSMTMTGMGSGSTTSSNSTDNGGIKLTPAIIATLAVIGGVVVSIFVGFCIQSRIREHKLRHRPDTSQQVASNSMSVSTYPGAAPSTVGGTLAAGSDSRLEKGMIRPVSMHLEQNQSAMTVPPFPRDEDRLVPQRATNGEAREAVFSPPAPPAPQFAGYNHPYSVAGSPSQEFTKPATPSPHANEENDKIMQQTNLSAQVIAPQPGNPTPYRSPNQPFLSPGGIQKADDNISDSGYDGATLVNVRRDPTVPSPKSTTSPRPLPRIPQKARVASLAQSSTTSEKKGDRSFLSFDEAAPNTGHNGLQPTISPAVVQRQPEQNITTTTTTTTRARGGSAAGIRLMSVIMDYEPELPDELEIRVGDSVRMIREYDDGWCIIELLNRPGTRPGTVPRMCLQDRN